MLSTKFKHTILNNPTHVVRSLNYILLLGLLRDLKDIGEYDTFNILYYTARVHYIDLQVDLVNYETCENIVLEIGIN
jgi:hypothetical protein